MANSSRLFDGIVVFVKTIEHGSFSKAAELLGHSPSYVSKEITSLEQRLGVRLINRTTRSINLTAAGKSYFRRCQQMVIDAETAEQSISAIQETPKGILRVTAPVSLGVSHLNHIIPRFLKAYPEVDLDIDYNQRKVDVVTEGFDVAIRVGILNDSNLIAKKIASASSITVASPEYLAKYGRPEKAEDLINHRVISYSNMGTPKSWELTDASGQKKAVKVSPRLICNDAELEVAVASEGLAILRLPKIFCQQAIDKGALISILPQYDIDEIGIYALYPHRQFLSAKVDVFIKFLAESLQDENKA